MPLSGTLTKARIVEAVVETNGYTQQKAHETVEILIELIKRERCPDIRSYCTKNFNDGL